MFGDCSRSVDSWADRAGIGRASRNYNMQAIRRNRLPRKFDGLLRAHTAQRDGFTLIEVCVAIVICVLFGAAAFTTNQRLLLALKSQKETTAATMVMQQRMEKLRATAFSNIATPSYLQSTIIANPTGSEGPLGNLTETFTVAAYDPATGNTAAGSTAAIVQRNSANPTGTIVQAGTNLTSTNLLRVDVVLNWASADARSRTRQLSSIFGLGNIAP